MHINSSETPKNRFGARRAESGVVYVIQHNERELTTPLTAPTKGAASEINS